MLTTIRTRFIQASFLALILSAALGLNYVIAWTGPTAAAPNSNAAAPLNVSAINQVKLGNMSIGSTTDNALNNGLIVEGGTFSKGEISSNMNGGYGQLRMVAGNYGAMFRNDGVNTYFLLTAAGDQFGIWNALRPFWIDDVSGRMSVGNGLTVYGGLTFPDGSVQTSAGGVPASNIVQVVQNFCGVSNSSTNLYCPGGYTAMSCGQQLTQWQGGYGAPDSLFVNGPNACSMVNGWTNGGTTCRNIVLVCLKN